MSKINLKTGSKRSSVLLLFSFYNFSTAVATLVANEQSSILNGLMDSHVLCRVGQRGAVVEVPAEQGPCLHPDMSPIFTL